MKQVQHRLTVRAKSQGLLEITREIAAWMAEQTIGDGLLTVFIRHTSASLLIQENADPNVQRDLETFLAKLVPENPDAYRHDSEGPDDMPAHIKGALTTTQLSIPVSNQRMTLGTWQGIYLFEHRRTPRDREIILHLIGE
jgi:secondary thiamine-phosphate synthase enzyme